MEVQVLDRQRAPLTCFATTKLKDREVKLTAPTSFLPFTMSTICRAMSSPQRAWASFVLAPRWGQLMTLGWSTSERFLGGSCGHKHKGRGFIRSTVTCNQKSAKVDHLCEDTLQQSCLNEDIEPGASTLSGLQSSEESSLIDDAPSRTVHHLHSFLAFSKRFIIKQTLGKRKKKKQLKKEFHNL